MPLSFREALNIADERMDRGHEGADRLMGVQRPSLQALKKRYATDPSYRQYVEGMVQQAHQGVLPRYLKKQAYDFERNILPKLRETQGGV